jgi:hypothetical protein
MNFNPVYIIALLDIFISSQMSNSKNQPQSSKSLYVPFCYRRDGCEDPSCTLRHPAGAPRPLPHSKDVSQLLCCLTSECPSLRKKNPRPCPFKHMERWSKFCRNGPKCAGINWGCEYNHKIPCRYGPTCYLKDCAFVHPCFGNPNSQCCSNPVLTKSKTGIATWQCARHRSSRGY